MAYTISKYRPRYPTTAHNHVHNGNKVYSLSASWNYNYDFWVCPYTTDTIRDSGEPYVIGMKFTVRAGTYITLAYSSSSGYMSTTNNSGITSLFHLYPATYGIELGEEFNLELVITQSQIQVYLNGVIVYTRTSAISGTSYLRWMTRDASGSATEIYMRSSYETRVLEERLGNWQFHEMEPVLPPGQPLTVAQLKGYTSMQDSLSVNFRLDPTPLSPQGEVVAMELDTLYLHRRRSPLGGSAQLRYEGIGEVTSQGLGLAGANSTSYSRLIQTQQAENLNREAVGGIMHQLRYTLTPDEFLG